MLTKKAHLNLAVSENSPHYKPTLPNFPITSTPTSPLYTACTKGSYNDKRERFIKLIFVCLFFVKA